MDRITYRWAIYEKTPNKKKLGTLTQHGSLSALNIKNAKSQASFKAREILKIQAKMGAWVTYRTKTYFRNIYIDGDIQYRIVLTH